MACKGVAVDSSQHSPHTSLYKSLSTLWHYTFFIQSD